MAEATLLCAQCDYDLRMLDPAGVCPECALPIEKSVAAAKAFGQRARRAWRRAALIMLGAQAARVVLLVAVLLWQRGSQDSWSFAEASLAMLNPWPLDELGPYVPDIVSSDEDLISRLFLSCWLVITLVHVWGCWLIGAKVIERRGWGWFRLMARWSGPVVIALWTSVWTAHLIRDDSIGLWVGLAMVLLPMVPTLAVLVWSGLLLSLLRAAGGMQWVIGVALSLSFVLEVLKLPGALQGEHEAAVRAAIAWAILIASSWMWIVLARQARRQGTMT